MTSEKSPYENVWNLIRRYEGITFHTKNGIAFTYHIRGTSIIVDRTNWPLNNKMLRHAYDLWPVEGPSGFNSVIQRSSYVWAILFKITKELEA